MKKVFLLLALSALLVASPAIGQTPQATAAGTEFYFTLFDFWNAGEQDTTNLPVSCGIGLNTVENTDLTFSAQLTLTGYTLHLGSGMAAITSLQSASDAVLKCVHVQSTGACYLNVWVNGSTCSAASVILPKHLLGTRYILQGVPGMMITSGGVQRAFYSQFTIIGTADGTSVRITPRTSLTCSTAPYSGQTLTAGQTRSFTLNENDVLLFRCADYSTSISGTSVESDKPVAVFQGNDLTRLPSNANGTDFMWEQARPTSAWGKEFAVPISSWLQQVTYQITAAEDNTIVHIHSADFPDTTGILQAGETLRRTLLNRYNLGAMYAEYVTTTKPACCYLYTTGNSLNKDWLSNYPVGDPAMIEIAPLDNMATEAYWNSGQTYSMPDGATLLVTTRPGNGSNITYNGLSLPGCNQPVAAYQSDYFETYEINQLNIINSLKAQRGGFCAYVLEFFGQSTKASAFNVSMPAPTEELCEDGTLLFREDFGGNSPNDPTVSIVPVPGMSSSYWQATNIVPIGDGMDMSTGRYLVTKKGYRNGIQWHLQDDHTYFGDYSRGYFLEVDGGGDGAPFYTTTIDGLCAGSELTFSAYVANVTYAGQIPYLQQHYGYIYPCLRFELTNPATGEVLASHSTGDIQPDYTKTWDINLSESADWQLVGMNFTVPAGITSVQLHIYNNTGSSGGYGNDFALDDIEVRLCMPPVTIADADSVCPFTSATLTAVSDYQQTAASPLEYRWWHSADSITWTEIEGATSATLSLPVVLNSDSGWFKVMMAAEENINSVNCRAESEPYKLNLRPFKQCVPPVSIRSPHNVCEGRHYRFNVRFDNNGIVTAPVAYRWQFISDLNPDIPVDDNNWTDLPAPDGQMLNPDFENIQVSDSGWYRIIIANESYINNPDYRAVSEPFLLRVNADCPICTDGRLLFAENLADMPATYTRTIAGTCGGTELSVIAHIADAPLPAGAQLTVTLTDAGTGEELKRYEADVTELEEWRRAGFNFGVPAGTTSVELTVTNEAQVSMADLEVYLCAPSVSITADDTICREAAQQFTAQLHNGTNDRLAFVEPLDYQWFYSSDQYTWTPVGFTTDSIWRILATQDADSGWYKVAVAEEGNSASNYCRTESQPVHLTIKKCLNPPQTQDTIVCDTLMPYAWRDILWQEVGDSDVMLRYTTGEDSVLMTYMLFTEHCCPDIRYGTCHLAICDTLLPFTWHYRDTSVVFADISDEHHIPIPHWHWTDCTDSVYTLTIDTFRCERLWPIIVNKYNWQLLLDHVTLRRFFPERIPKAYQWYKDSVAIDGATDDDYSEQNELHGTYQLLVWMDDDSYIWSNTITLNDTPEPLPVSIHIYNSHGLPVTDDRLTRGVYIIHYRQGDRVWAEKKIVL